MLRPRKKRPCFTVHVKWFRHWPGRSDRCWGHVGRDAKALKIKSNDLEGIGKLVRKWEHMT